MLIRFLNAVFGVYKPKSLQSTSSIMDEFTIKFKKQVDLQKVELVKQGKIADIATAKESAAASEIKIANRAIKHFENILGA